MERKIINYTIKYFERGKDKEKNLTIKRVSRGVIHDYSVIVSTMTIVDYISKQRNMLVSNLGHLIVSDKKLRERIKEAEPLKTQIQALDKQLKSANVDGIFKECVKLVGRILEDNGIEDKELSEEKFWLKKTEERDLWDFLNSVVYKDVQQSKKKVPSMM